MSLVLKAYHLGRRKGTQEIPDAPLTTIIVVIFACIGFNITVGKAITDFLGITYHEPRWFQHVVYDGEYEQHVQLSEWEVEE